jgi:hypothetical protein
VPGLVLGQITGAGMFTTTIVAGAVIFVAHGIRARFPLLRDMQMYLCAVIALGVIVNRDVLEIYTAILLLCYYCMFIGLAYYSDQVHFVFQFNILPNLFFSFFFLSIASRFHSLFPAETAKAGDKRCDGNTLWPSA